MKCYKKKDKEKCKYFKEGKCVADFKCWWNFKEYNGKLDNIN